MIKRPRVFGPVLALFIQLKVIKQKLDNVRVLKYYSIKITNLSRAIIESMTFGVILASHRFR